jgi:hypothetical protein
MRLILTALLTIANYFGLTTLMHAYQFQMDPAITVFLALLLAVIGMVLIVIPIGNWLGITNDGQASDGGGWSLGGDDG